MYLPFIIISTLLYWEVSLICFTSQTTFNWIVCKSINFLTIVSCCILSFLILICGFHLQWDQEISNQPKLEIGKFCFCCWQRVEWFDIKLFMICLSSVLTENHWTSWCCSHTWSKTNRGKVNLHSAFLLSWKKKIFSDLII